MITLFFFAIVIIWFKQKVGYWPWTIAKHYINKVNENKTNCNIEIEIECAFDFWSYCNTQKIKKKQIIPSDLRRFCLRFLGVIMDTQILSNQLKLNFHSLLKNVFQNKVKNNGYIDMTLLYRATPQTFDLNSFFSQCDGCKNIFIILQTEFDKVIGGFMSQGIPHSKGVTGFLRRLLGSYDNLSLRSDPNTFLFSITESQIFMPKDPKINIKIGTVFFSNDSVFGFGAIDFCLQRSDLTCFTMSHTHSYYEFDKFEFLGVSRVNQRAYCAKCNFKLIEIFCAHVS